MNAEWWKGRSSRTGQEGIFPSSYVKVLDEKSAAAAQDTKNTGNDNNYGNMPLESTYTKQSNKVTLFRMMERTLTCIASQMGNGTGKVPTKTEGKISPNSMILEGSQV